MDGLTRLFLRNDYSLEWWYFHESRNISPLCDIAQTSDCGILVFTFDISPLCDVAQTSDCGMLSFTFNISPFCDVAQTSDCGMHCYLYSIISPFCDVALTPDCGIVISFVSSRGVIQTLVWPSVLFWDFGRTSVRLPFYFPMHCYLILWVRFVNLFICIMFTFVISYVRTVLRVLS